MTSYTESISLWNPVPTSSTPHHLQHFNNTFHTPHTTTSHPDIQLSVHSEALALLQQFSSRSNDDNNASNSNNRNPLNNPNIRIQNPTSHEPRNGQRHSGTACTSTIAPANVRHDSRLVDAGVAVHDWQSQPMFGNSAPVFSNSMGGGNQGGKRPRTHQRTPSASTVNSAGPASPFMQNLNGTSYPHIANTDQPPNSPYYADQALAKNLPTPSHTPTDSGVGSALYVPSQAAHMPNAHLAMKDFGIGHHNSEEYLSDHLAPSRQSMSSYSNDSPATPQSGVGDVDTKQYVLPQNDYTNGGSIRQNNSNVQLYRTESQAYADELFVPNFARTSAPAKSSKLLSPHRSVITERLQTANLARSASPASALSRERSPFRDGSEFAQTRDWKTTDGRLGTAAGMRQQQKEEAAEAEYAQHRVALRREPTKTISPKDAVLDYHEDQPPLFQDTIPAGYERHTGGTEQWPTNTYFSQPSGAFGDLSSNGQNISFRNATASADADFAATPYDYSGLPQGAFKQVQNSPFHSNYQAAAAAKMNNFSDSTPDFPATIPSMETSISDAGLPASSQDSNGNTSTPHRPDDTRANTGTYTCTYHGCTQRFDSHANLQRHKRDYHRSQHQQPTRDTTSTASDAGSVSPRSTESPAPSGSGMTSAALLARNSQAGPHKCTRINPSTNKPCNTIFSRPYDLTRHEDTIHNNRKQKVRCPMCREEKTFSRNDALTRHMRVVHPEVESFGKRGRRGD